ncbi:IS1380 family transposase [Streptomyces acidiscabies]|uniref:IS1380 family transposase n=3 Tax=Streptomyces acidiscabies TaxID=42234 RepID=A0AAP6BM05_9ACTN|nr:IS1380 family transposase [Streptomyces acidiscabies]MDX2966967.1 IS1380 family transposase [Streptomyces acidiscabies]MDX3026221.1 IS1380 family transposase [Streptomyces acidiscabies]MDX3796845.1 IS1380 family transposase [Streptomyces acidiscabies]GAQ59603.1 transposase DDE domain protein [Streptomyces acidiscabies]
MRNTTAWDHGLRVGADGKGIVGHSGAVLLRRLADRSGLVTALARVFPVGGSGWRNRGVVFVHLAISIVLGARSVLEAEQLALHQRHVFGLSASDSTIRRLLAGLDDTTFAAVARARAAVRQIVWTWLALRPGGFPWLTVAGKHLHRWVIVDIDATIITAASKKEGASATFKRTFGFHPLAAWCANTQECLAMLLRTGGAGSNTATDHITVLDEALAQIPHSSSAKILVRLDGAGATHDLHEHMEKLTTTRRRVRFTTGWKITAADEAAIAELPERAWESSLKQDGDLHDDDHSQVAELTGLNRREGWLDGMRLIVRRVRPSGRHTENLTDLEKKTGWKYSIVATNITRLWGIAGSHQIQWIDALHRHHAVVEDRVRTNKAMGLHNLPAKSWTGNRSWMLAANIAADLDAWLRLLALHDQEGLADAEPQTMRMRIYHQAGRLARHARVRRLRLDASWPWSTAFALAWNRLTRLPQVT